MMLRVIGAALCAGLVLTTAGCGNGDDDKAAKALSASLRQNNDSQGLQLDKKQSDCVGKKLVEKVGTKDLQKYGILTKDLKAKDNVTNVKMSTEDAQGAADAVTECIDAVEFVVKSLGTYGGKKVQDCVREKVKEDDVNTFLAKGFEGKQDQAQEQLGKTLMVCASAAQK